MTKTENKNLVEKISKIKNVFLEKSTKIYKSLMSDHNRVRKHKQLI